MISTLLYWLLPALLLFWSVGAYNRLMRLRKRVARSFAALDALLVKRMVLIQSCLPPSLRTASTQGATPTLDRADAAWASLQAAAEQFGASLALAREQPLNPAATAALTTALGVLDGTWARLWHQASDLAGEPLPPPMGQEYTRLHNQAQPLAEAYNAAVLTHNQGISGFPAVLLAHLFSFRAAGLLTMTETSA